MQKVEAYPRIMVVYPEFRRGGGEVVAVWTLQALQELSNVTLVTASDDGWCRASDDGLVVNLLWIIPAVISVYWLLIVAFDVSGVGSLLKGTIRGVLARRILRRLDSRR